MNLFIIGWNLPKEGHHTATEELSKMVEVYPQLDPNTVWHHSSPCGTLFIASMHTNKEVASPRDYVLQSDNQVVFYSGLPVDPSGRYAAHRANVLAEQWAHLAENLEGQHVLIRATCNPLHLELVTDFLSMEQVYYHQHDNYLLISNSVQLIEKISGLRELDPLGVSLYLSAGWPGADRTLRKNVRVIPGGEHWSVKKGDVKPQKHRYCAPASFAHQPRPKLTQSYFEQLGNELTQLCHSLSDNLRKIRCPLTGGRDSRLLATLLTRAGLPAQYFTAGEPSSDDVTIGSEIAKKLNLSHKIYAVTAGDVIQEWDRLSWRLIRQNDGMSSLWQIADTINQSSQIDHLDLSLWGIGGEIARGFFSDPNFYLSRHKTTDVQGYLAKRKIHHADGLVSQQAVELSRDYIHRFVTKCVDDGFSPVDAPDLYYTYQRVGRWGGNNARRMVMVGDLFSPFCSRPFVKATFAMSARQRYTEPLHYALIQLLAPELHSMAFDKEPWRLQQPIINILYRYGAPKINGVLRRICHLIPRRHSNLKESPEAKQPPVFDRKNWLEVKRKQIREICLDQSDTRLWDFVDRPTFERVMSPQTTPEGRARHLNTLYTIATLFYYEADKR